MMKWGILLCMLGLYVNAETCGEMSSCKECAGRRVSAQDGLISHCYWCETSKNCVAEDTWSDDSTCGFWAYSTVFCPAQVVTPFITSKVIVQTSEISSFRQNNYDIFGSSEILPTGTFTGSFGSIPVYTVDSPASDAGIMPYDVIEGDEENTFEPEWGHQEPKFESTGSFSKVVAPQMTMKPTQSPTAAPSIALTTSRPAEPVSKSADLVWQPVEDLIPQPGPLSKLESTEATCESLGWEMTPGSPRICGGSLINGECITDANFFEANLRCKSIGARLCSAGELMDNEAKGTGCKFDDERIWSSTPCPGGAITTQGSSKGVADQICTSLRDTFGVRCCATQPINSIENWIQTCEDLDWEVTIDSSCANSKVKGECPSQSAYQTARDNCFSVGARLCSIYELESGVAVGSGCKLDNALVWSETPCPGGYLVKQGDGGGERICMPPSRPHFSRCCAYSNTKV